MEPREEDRRTARLMRAPLAQNIEGGGAVVQQKVT